MKQSDVEEVRNVQEETLSGQMACKKILLDRYHSEERAEMMALIKKLFFLEKDDHDYDLALKQVLEYLVRNS